MARGPGDRKPALDRGALFAARRRGPPPVPGRAVRAHRDRADARARVLVRQSARGSGARVLRHRGAAGAAFAAPRETRDWRAACRRVQPRRLPYLSEVPDCETLWLVATGTGLAPF